MENDISSTHEENIYIIKMNINILIIFESIDDVIFGWYILQGKIALKN